MAQFFSRGNQEFSPAVIAEMLVQNPKLNFEQQKALLQQFAVKLSDVPQTGQGSGELNGAASILAVREKDSSVR